MLNHFIVLCVFVSNFLIASTLTSVIVTTVNGDPIYETDLSSDSIGQSRDEKIKRAIQYKLIIQEAKKRGLDRAPDVQSEINKLLYKKFIDEEKKARKKEAIPSEAELLSFYGKYPLIRIHHLVLNKKSETDKQIATLALEQINKELKKGTPFETLCSQFSQDSSSLFGGDADFRGPHNFPEDLYIKIKSLPKNTISEPIEIGQRVHLFQWFEKKPFTSAPASYLQFLQAKLEQEHEIEILKEAVLNLEIKAIVEPKPSSVGSR